MRNKSKILIVNDKADCGRPYSPLFSFLGEVVHDPAHLKLQPMEYKLVVFTGGSDVTPSFYGDTAPKGYCHFNTARDVEEKRIFGFARQRGVKMVGICRGMQFLNVMAGGKLMHDIQDHNGRHKTMTKDREEPFITNSYHHQMCIPSTDTEILAWSHEKLSAVYIGDKDEPVDYKGPEVEAIWNYFDKFIGVQWHPECMERHDDGQKWFMHLLRDFMTRTPQEMKKLYLGMGGAKLAVEYKHG